MDKCGICLKPTVVSTLQYLFNDYFAEYIFVFFLEIVTKITSEIIFPNIKALMLFICRYFPFLFNYNLKM